MKQWWELKQSHFDTVLFFKMGKFYELFHMDADIAVKELGVIYMKVSQGAWSRLHEVKIKDSPATRQCDLSSLTSMDGELYGAARQNHSVQL